MAEQCHGVGLQEAAPLCGPPFCNLSWPALGGINRIERGFGETSLNSITPLFYQNLSTAVYE